jgi:hypothetical protein
MLFSTIIGYSTLGNYNLFLIILRYFTLKYFRLIHFKLFLAMLLLNYLP